MSHELFYVYMHAAEVRIAQSDWVRFREAVAAVQTGYVIARNPKALREWQRWKPKGGRRQGIGLTGEALERTMSVILLAHPEFQKGVPRPPHLQPHSMKKAKRARKGKG